MATRQGDARGEHERSSVDLRGAAAQPHLVDTAGGLVAAGPEASTMLRTLFLLGVVASVVGLKARRGKKSGGGDGTSTTGPPSTGAPAVRGLRQRPA